MKYSFIIPLFFFSILEQLSMRENENSFLLDVFNKFNRFFSPILRFDFFIKLFYNVIEIKSTYFL